MLTLCGQPYQKNIAVVNEVYTAKSTQKRYWTIAATSGDLSVENLKS